MGRTLDPSIARMYACTICMCELLDYAIKLRKKEFNVALRHMPRQCLKESFHVLVSSPVSFTEIK